jgi:hypothetical protein
LQPSKEKIEQIKAQFPDRELYLVEALDAEDEVLTFVMTSPERGEYRIYVDKMMEAGAIKSEAEKTWKVREIIENAALGQIRWPDREDCQKAFRMRPAMVDGFAEELQKAAGAHVELRSKKL